MNKERLDRLKNIIESEKYIINKDTGSVYSTFVRREKSPCPDGEGYLQLGLSFERKQYMYKIHEIVAFLNGMDLLDKTVDHIDGDKYNNCPQNLETITREENISRRHMVIRTGKHVNPATGKRISAVKCCYKNGFSSEELSEIFNMPLESISNIILEMEKNEVRKQYGLIVDSLRDEIQGIMQSELNKRFKQAEWNISAFLFVFFIYLIGYLVVLV